MQQPSPLFEELSTCFGWHQARIKCLEQLLYALIKVRTVNLTEVATGVTGNARPEAKYRRLQRFFSQTAWDFAQVALLIVAFLALPERWIVTLDRTQWKLGKTDLNFLVLAVVCQGIAVPLFWTVLEHPGNSDTAQRQALLKQFLRFFGAERLEFITADREFVGKEWLRWLHHQALPYCLRLKSNFQLTNAKGKERPAWVIFQNLSRGAHEYWPKRRLWGIEVCITCQKRHDGQLLLLAHNLPSEDSAHALRRYAQRWKIESLFGCLKSRGFRLEETHMTDPKKLAKLWGVLALVVCWALKTGEFRQQQKPIALKKHKRPAVSLFRYGLDLLRSVLLDLDNKKQELTFLIHLLTCT